MNINDVLIAIIFLIPNKSINLRLSEHSIGVVKKQLENIGFLGCQLEFFALFSDRVVV
ncbi:hypothetical protein D3C76_1483500 [compost metagenome]